MEDETHSSVLPSPAPIQASPLPSPSTRGSEKRRFCRRALRLAAASRRVGVGGPRFVLLCAGAAVSRAVRECIEVTVCVLQSLD